LHERLEDEKANIPEQFKVPGHFPFVFELATSTVAFTTAKLPIATRKETTLLI